MPDCCSGWRCNRSDERGSAASRRFDCPTDAPPTDDVSAPPASFDELLLASSGDYSDALPSAESSLRGFCDEFSGPEFVSPPSEGFNCDECWSGLSL